LFDDSLIGQASGVLFVSGKRRYKRKKQRNNCKWKERDEETQVRMEQRHRK